MDIYNLSGELLFHSESDDLSIFDLDDMDLQAGDSAILIFRA